MWYQLLIFGVLLECNPSGSWNFDAHNVYGRHIACCHSRAPSLILLTMTLCHVAKCCCYNASARQKRTAVLVREIFPSVSLLISVQRSSRQPLREKISKNLLMKILNLPGFQNIFQPSAYRMDQFFVFQKLNMPRLIFYL